MDTIGRIIELTKEKKLEWEYLEVAKDIYEPLNYKPDEPSNNALSQLTQQLSQNKFKYFDTANSFYCKVKDNYIVLVATNEKEKILIDKLKLILVPWTFKEPKYFDGEKQILELHNLVKSYFPSADDIINDLFFL